MKMFYSLVITTSSMKHHLTETHEHNFVIHNIVLSSLSISLMCELASSFRSVLWRSRVRRIPGTSPLTTSASVLDNVSVEPFTNYQVGTHHPTTTHHHPTTNTTAAANYHVCVKKKQKTQFLDINPDLYHYVSSLKTQDI